MAKIETDAFAVDSRTSALRRSVAAGVDEWIGALIVEVGIQNAQVIPGDQMVVTTLRCAEDGEEWGFADATLHRELPSGVVESTVVADEDATAYALLWAELNDALRISTMTMAPCTLVVGSAQRTVLGVYPSYCVVHDTPGVATWYEVGVDASRIDGRFGEMRMAEPVGVGTLELGNLLEIWDIEPPSEPTNC